MHERVFVDLSACISVSLAPLGVLLKHVTELLCEIYKVAGLSVCFLYA